jgi:hypothetical protein
MGQDCAKTDSARHPAEGWRFNLKKRTYENNALIAFIDLLGTRALYESPLPVQDQAQKVFNELIGQFDIKFCTHFSAEQIQTDFDVSIFGDSIVISQRKKTPKAVERLANFLLDYHADLLLNRHSPSRAVLTRDSFFSFKITDASERSIIGSPYTTVSLCGGRGIVKCACDYLKGLPIGVYVTHRIKTDLNGEQRASLVPVKHESLCLLKWPKSIRDFLPQEADDLLRKQPNAGREAVRDSVEAAFRSRSPSDMWAGDKGLAPWAFLRASFQDQDTWDRWAPWIMIHLGMENEIVRATKVPKGEAPESCPGS